MLRYECVDPERFEMIDKKALLNLFQAFSKFYSRIRENISLSDLEFESLLNCIENVMLLQNIPADNVFCAIETLIELKNWGFSLSRNFVLTREEDSAYEYKLKLQFKQELAKLFIFRKSNNEFNFRNECSDFIKENYMN